MMNSKKNISQITITLALYYSTLMLGWQVASFVYIYASMDDAIIRAHLEKFFYFQPYLLGTGLIISIFSKILAGLYDLKDITVLLELRKNAKVAWGYLLWLISSYLLFKVHSYLHVFDLITFLFSLWLIYWLGSVLNKAAMPGWYHPTTHGSLYMAAALNGCVLLDVFNMVKLENTGLVYLVLLLLTFEIIILYARFQHLAKHSQETNRLARRLMGSQILFFGTRIMVGIFMPMIFLIYSVFSGGKSVEGVAVLILAGTLLERYLFVITGSE